ncbi:MAG: CPBP family intramembrane glutamic endopeptidase [Litorimonas sp.]
MMTHKAISSRSNVQVALIVIIGFFVSRKFIPPVLRKIMGGIEAGVATLWQDLTIRIIVMILVPALITALIVGRKNVLQIWGFDKAPWRGLGFAALCMLPLPLVYAFSFPLSDMSTVFMRLLHGAVIPGTTEEIWFRCFLFGLLFRVANWGFLPAAILGAIIFGAAHLYQGNAVLDSVGVFAITGAASLWWAWIYVEWDYNPWVPIGFHVLMNGCFVVFTVSDTALLPIVGEVARASVVIISVGLTLWIRQRQGGRKITGRLWIKPPPPEIVS